MTTYNTGNPIGSTDARDLYDNAQNLDNFANGASASYADRLGVIRRSLAGIEATAEGVLNGIGYAVPVAYASGISLTLTSQTVDYNGVIYAPLSSALPFTTSSWGADSAKFRAIQVTDADLITYTPAGTGAVATTVQSKLRESVSVKDFIPAGTDTANVDCTPYIQAAINASYGKTLYVPAGSYYINTVTNSAILSIAGRIKIVADFGAEFRYGTAAGATVDVIRIDPQTVADEGIEIDGLWIYEKSGSPARDVLKIYLDATHGLKKLRLTNCLFRAKTGYAVRCLNSTYLNTNGLFLTDIDKCEFVGGFYSDGHGDTTRIANSAFTGQNRGIEIEMLPPSAGAGSSSSVQIVNNNITSTGGAIYIRRGRNVMIEGNNIEQLTDFSGNYAVQLNYLDYDTSGVSWVRGNKIEPNDPASKCGGLAMYRCKNTIVEGNQIGTSAKTSSYTVAVSATDCDKIKVFYNDFYLSDACVGVLIDALTKNLSYKPGNILNATATFLELSDSGVATKGSFKYPTYQNSWTTAGNGEYSPRYIKTDENLVLIEGVVASGTLTSNTVMFTLPVGLRPSYRQVYEVSTLTSGGVFGRARVRIDSDGSVRMQNSSEGAVQLLELSLSGTMFTAPDAT